MNLTELNNEFDILFEDLATAGSKGLDKYEKSVCYTYAQQQLVLQMAMQNNLSPIQRLIKEDIQAVTPSTLYPTGYEASKVDTSYYDLSYVAQGSIGGNAKDIPGSEVQQSIIDRMLATAYQYPPKNLVYVVVGENTNIVFPPLSFNMTQFKTRYVDNPSPIILETLTGGLTIDGITAETLPVITEPFHRNLVNTAVQYAIQIYIGQPEKEQAGGSS